MRAFVQLLAELLWLAGAVVVAWFFLRTFLAVEVVSAVATLILRRVERAWQ